jgi:hypothetical protein
MVKRKTSFWVSDSGPCYALRTFLLQAPIITMKAFLSAIQWADTDNNLDKETQM